MIFLNNCLIKPAVFCERLSKFGIFSFVVSHTMLFIVVFLKWGSKQDFGSVVGEHRR